MKISRWRNSTNDPEIVMESVMANDEQFQIHVAVPHGFQMPFHEVVNHVSSLGMKVDQTKFEVQSILGTGTQHVLDRIKEMGLAASRDQRMTWDV
ncbi:MAG: hypothetical protein NVSMB9_32870 [Isosphaeraceae bacterium]